MAIGSRWWRSLNTTTESGNGDGSLEKKLSVVICSNDFDEISARETISGGSGRHRRNNNVKHVLNALLRGEVVGLIDRDADDRVVERLSVATACAHNDAFGE